MPLSATEAKLLGAICATFARYRTGDAIVGAELERWIRTKVGAFRRAVADPTHHRGGYKVFGFRSWLEQGGDTAEPWRAADDPPPPPKVFPRPVFTTPLSDAEAGEVAKRRAQALFGGARP